jgi:two-component system, sensor histidine kinase PdtaS
MITAQDLRDGLARTLVHGTGEGPGTPAGLHAALASGDVMELKEPVRLAGRDAACAGHTLATVLERWETLVVEAAAGLHVATRGAAWLAQGYAETRTRRDGDSLQQATDSLASRKAELSALHRVNAAANSSLDERAILATVVQVVAEVTGAAVCSIYLLQPPGTLMLAATKGLNPDAIGRATMPLGNGITGWAAKERRTIAVPDIWRDPRANYLPETSEEPFHSMVSVPIVNRSLDRLLGVLNVQTEEPRAFEDDEIAFLEMVSGDLALAIENARSYALTDRQLHRKVEELTALRRVIAMVASSLEFQRVLDSIAEGAVTLVGADASAIVVADGPTGSAARVAACYGIAEGHGCTGHADEGPVAHALATGQPVVVPDIVARRQDPGGDDVALRQAFCSMFLVPFQGRHHTRGALCVYSRTSRTWTREEVDLVAAFAGEAAMALENASLYEEAQRGLATKSVLLSELHHRVKNNLQNVASLLSLGLRHATAPEARLVLEESRTRIQSIAAVHDLLSQGDVGLTTIGDVARKMAEIAEQGAAPHRHVRMAVHGDRIALATQQATTLAIVLNELLTNALRHAFHGRAEGSVAITHRTLDRRAELTVADDGVGLPPGFDPERDQGLGLSIVAALTRQDLRGELHLGPNAAGGTTVSLRFPLGTGAQQASA